MSEERTNRCSISAHSTYLARYQATKATHCMTSTTVAIAEPSHRFRTGVALAIGGTFLFALKSIFIKFAFAAGTDATTLLTLRMGLSIPFYVGMLIYLNRNSNRPASTVPHSEHVGIKTAALACSLGFFGYYLASYLDMAALELISAQLERLTLFTYPAIIAVLAWMFLGEELNRTIITAIVLCYCGIMLMYSQEKQLMVGSDVTLGMLLVLGSALSYSFYVLLSKPVMQRIGSRKFTCFAMLGSTAFVAVHFLLTQDLQQTRIPAIVWAYAVALSFVCTVIPSFLINEAILRLGASRTTIIGSVGPVVTMMLAIGLLREPSSIWHFLGMALVVFGVMLVARKS